MPVPGALVGGGTELVTADAEGRYILPVVPVGRRTIEAVDPENGTRGSRGITILTAGQMSENIDIILEPLGSISGRVFDPMGEFIANQEVLLIVRIRDDFFGVRRTRTDGDGVYGFDRVDVRSQPYPITATRNNEVANATSRLSPLLLDDIVDLNMISPTGRISGRVLDETGLAVATQISVKARVPNSAGILEFKDVGTVISDPDDGFALDGLFPGPF